MAELRRILVPVDGSENEDKVLEMAVTIASACQSEIHLLYVSYFDGDTDSKIEMISWLPEQVVGSVTKASRAILDHAMRKISSGILCETHVRTGIPSKEIVTFAEAQAMDLIVIGGRGLGIVESFLLGSVSQSVLEDTKCTVMIVR